MSRTEADAAAWLIVVCVVVLVLGAMLILDPESARETLCK